MVAVRAAHAQEAVFETAAFEVSIEFTPDILRQDCAKGGRLIQECRVMLPDDPVQESLFGTVALAAVNDPTPFDNAQDRLGTGRKRQPVRQAHGGHDRVLAVGSIEDTS